MLALTQASLGEVVVTKKNIPLNTGGPVSIDLNKDGLADFQFSHYKLSHYPLPATFTLKETS